MDFAPVRGWIMNFVPAPLRPTVKGGYRITREIFQAASPNWIRISRVTWLRPEVADLETVNIVRPKAGQVLLRTHASLISPGTERAFLLGLPNTDSIFPSVAGYSAAGVVEEVGRGVSNLKPGDRAAGVSLHASRWVVDHQKLVRIPDGVSDEDAAFIELGVIAMQGVRRAEIRPGERVVVLGQGLIGQLAIQIARWAGAAPIIAVARTPALAEIALASGADETVALENDPGAPARLQADVVIEATGSPQAVTTALECAAPGGRVELLGSARGITSDFSFDTAIAERNLTVIGAHITSIAQSESGHGRWTRADEGSLFLDLVANGSLNPAVLISHRMDPEDANRVYDELVLGDTRSMGIVFDWKKQTETPKSMPSPTTTTPSTAKAGRKLRLALIGCGEISTLNAAGIRASQICEIAQVMDVHEATARSLGKQFNVPFTTDLEAVLGNPDVDAVVVAIPHHLHASTTAKAAAAGKHVIVEKPISTNLEDADAMIESCRKAGVALSVLFSFRYQPHIVRARELVQAGALGDVVGTSIQFATEKPAGYWGQGYTGRVLTDWRGSIEKCGGGVLIMNVCHTIDYFQFITGLRVSQVYSEFGTLNSPVEVEDIVAVTLRYEGGGIGSIQASTLARGDQMAQERIWGTHGSMVLAPSPPQIYKMRRVAGLVPGKWQGFGKMTKKNRVAEFMDDFARAVFDGREPGVTGLDGRENLAVVLAAYEAGREGQAKTPSRPTEPLEAPVA